MSKYNMNNKKDKFVQSQQEKDIKVDKQMNTQKENSKKQSICVYKQFLEQSFILAVKLNQLQNQVQIVESQIQKEQNINELFYSIYLSQFVNIQSEVQVSILDKSLSFMSDKIVQIFDVQMQSQLLKVLQIYINKYNDVLAIFSNQETANIKSYTLTQKEEVNDLIQNVIKMQIKHVQIGELIYLVELVIESTRNDPKTAQDQLNKQINEILNKYETKDMKPLNIFCVQNQFIYNKEIPTYQLRDDKIVQEQDQMEMFNVVTSEGNKSDLLQILQIPGLNIERFKKFVEMASPLITIQGLSSKTEKFKLNNETLNPSLKNVEQIRLIIQNEYNLINSEILNQQQQEKLTTLHNQFEHFKIWTDILVFQSSNVTLQNKDSFPENINQWTLMLLNEPHLKQIQGQVGFNLDKCLRLLFSLEINTIKELISVLSNEDSEEQEIQIDQTWLQQAKSLDINRIIGILIYSSKEVILRLTSLQKLVYYVNDVKQLLLQ